jgi:hypothetical protein
LRVGWDYLPFWESIHEQIIRYEVDHYSICTMHIFLYCTLLFVFVYSNICLFVSLLTVVNCIYGKKLSNCVISKANRTDIESIAGHFLTDLCFFSGWRQLIYFLTRRHKLMWSSQNWSPGLNRMKRLVLRAKIGKTLQLFCHVCIMFIEWEEMPWEPDYTLGHPGNVGFQILGQLFYWKFFS